MDSQQKIARDDFARLLGELKQRSRRSYEALARRVGISSSALHRYCTGSALPPDFSVVDRFARACRATRDELVELRRLWLTVELQRQITMSTTSPDDMGRADQAAAISELTDTVPPLSRGDAGEVNPLTAVPPTPVPSVATSDVGNTDVVAWRRMRWWWLWLATGLVVAMLGVLVASNYQDQPEASRSVPLLLSSACPPVMKLGDKGECVRELQTSLYNLGGVLAIDGDFGPRTRMRTIGFQVLAGLPATAEVDERTKRAVYAKKTKLHSWPAPRIEERIRQVFPEEPDRAVGVARCLSRLDPLWVLPNINGTHNWGVFQIYDRTLQNMDATPLQAFDPELNIQMARRIWERTRDFTNWEHCGAAVPPTATPGIQGN